MILQTNLKHIQSESDFHELIKSKPNVMICCGRMGPMCIPVYQVMKEIEGIYPHVEFYDMLFDAPFAHTIRNLPECSSFRGLPFTVYFKDGKVVKATTSIQGRDEISEILDEHFVN